MFSYDISRKTHHLFPEQVTSRFFCFDSLQYQDNLFNSLNIVCPPSIQKSVVKRKSEFLAGRHCAHECLSRYNINDDIKIGPHREPIWPKGFLGSISHTDDIAGAIVTPSKDCLGVGLDIENIMDNETADNISSQILSANELDYCTSISLERNVIFTLIFSAKESFFKAAFSQVKQYFDFHAVEMVSLTEDTIGFKVLDVLNGEFKPGYQFTIHWQKINANTLLTFILL